MFRTISFIQLSVILIFFSLLHSQQSNIKSHSESNVLKNNDYVVVSQLNLWYYGTGRFGGFEAYDGSGKPVVSLMPYLGYYYCIDPAVIHQQIEWASNYGVDVFTLQYTTPPWIPGSLEDNYDNAFLKADNLYKVRWCIFYDPVLRLQGTNFKLPDLFNLDNIAVRDTIIFDMKRLAKKYFHHPMYFAINQRPVIYIWASWQFVGDIETTFTAIRDSVAILGYDVFIVGDEITANNFDAHHAKQFDANSNFVMLMAGAPPMKNMDDAANASNTIFQYWKNNILTLNVQDRSELVSFQPGWAPQFKDSLFKINNNLGTPIYIPAENKEQVIKMATVARENAVPLIPSGQSVIWIATFNNWAETTTIEPTAALGPKYPAGNYQFDMLDVVREVYGNQTFWSPDHDTLGMNETAISFPQEGDYLEIPNMPAYHTSQLTIEFWIKLNSVNNQQERSIIDIRDPNGGFQIRAAGNQFPLFLFFVARDDKGETIAGTDSGVLFSDTWHHIATTYDMKNIKIYVDGILAGSKPCTKDVSRSITSMLVGEAQGYPNISFPVYGEIDELRIWNKARSQVKINANKQIIFKGESSELIGYWRFEELDDNLSPDKSCVQNNAKFIGNSYLVPSSLELSYLTGLHQENHTVQKLELYQNYPNPFNAKTMISYTLKEKQHVSVTIYDLLGRKIKELVNEQQLSGIYSVSFDAEKLPSGIYFCILATDYFKAIRKMVLVE